MSGDPCCYDLTPFAVSHPALASAWQTVTKEAGALGAGTALTGLRAWREAHPGDVDSVEGRAALWVIARLERELKRDAEADAALRELTALPYGAFSDLARGALADRLVRAKDAVGAAELRLTRLPATPGFTKDALKAVTALERAGKAARAAELLADVLERSLDGADRAALVERLAELRWRLGDKAEARRLAGDLWWRAKGDADRGRAEALLKRFKAPVDAYDRLARDVIDTGRPSRKDRRKLKKTRIGGRLKATVRVWAEALFDRYEDPAAALKRLQRYARYVKKASAFAPWFRFGEAELLRKLDRDAEAVDAYLEVAERWPEHPVVVEALERASGLLRYLERAADANAVDQRLVARGGHDEAHRKALWRVGFDAWLAGNPSGAAIALGRLSDRYGGEPDVWAMMWGERADYWRARAAEAQGDRAGAHALYTNVCLRFPTSWYALLARDRLGADAPDDALTRALPRTPWLDTAVALTRLGDRDGAIDALEALLAADYLPGRGRALLAELLTQRGDASRAARIAKKSFVPPFPIDDGSAETLRAWFPFDFAEAVQGASAEHAVPASLLAGIASVETGFHPRATSAPGAIGLCQLMPRTGTALGRRLYGRSFSTRQLYEPETNLRVAAYLLSLLRERWGDQPAVLAAAYNAGNGPVRRWIAAHGHLDTDAFVELIPYRQARRYVKRVMATSEIYRRLYGLDVAPLPLPRMVQPPLADPLEGAEDPAPRSDPGTPGDDDDDDDTSDEETP
ncbi:MAG: hypothetical protein EP329_06630 [Deltaproteobacteria bacterium]|nr:MAG: hypothetical protein EP329_06630 [Deltaproteobacteria bacterium]